MRRVRHRFACALLVAAGLHLGPGGSGVFAAPGAAGTAPSAAEVADAPFLWRVEGPQATHYLMGSVHLLPDSAYPLPAALEQAYAQTAGLVLETDLAALEAPDVQARMLRAGVSQAGLQHEIGDALYARVRRHAQASELAPSVCDRFRAWFCALTLGLIEFQRAGMLAGSGLDQHFYARAQGDHRPLQWLETPQAQLDLFAGMSPAMGQRFLESSLEDLGRADLKPESLIRIWRTNDVDALSALIDDSARQFPETHVRLLAGRNRAWMATLLPLLNGRQAQLVVVGAAHLVGRDSLLRQLRERGLDPQPVR